MKKEKQPGKRAIIAAEKSAQRERIKAAQSAIDTALNASRVPARIMQGGVQEAIAWKDAMFSAKSHYHLVAQPSKRLTAQKLGGIAADLEAVLASIA